MGRLGPVCHRDGGFDPEVLNDYFLDVAIALVQVGMASSVSMRSSGDSPMPISRPVVKGTFLLPASSMVRRRLAGSLSGALSWAAPAASSEAFVVSSMSPMLGETSESREIHSALSKPGLGCGSRFVSRRTSLHMASR